MIDAYIEQYGRRLFGLCCTLCAGVLDAEDLYQETWLKVCSTIRRYDPSRPFEPYLTQICVNTYRDMLRRHRRSPFFNRFTSTEEKDAVLEAVPASGESSDYPEVRQAVDRLPEKLRTVVILYYFYSWDIRRTAEALHIPEGTVKSRLHHAKKVLRKELADEADLFL